MKCPACGAAMAQMFYHHSFLCPNSCDRRAAAALPAKPGLWHLQLLSGAGVMLLEKPLGWNYAETPYTPTAREHAVAFEADRWMAVGRVIAVRGDEAVTLLFGELALAPEQEITVSLRVPPDFEPAVSP